MAEAQRTTPDEDIHRSLEDEARESIAEVRDEVRAWLQVADDAIRDFVDEQPLLAVGGALVAGYLLGRLLARR